MESVVKLNGTHEVKLVESYKGVGIYSDEIGYWYCPKRRGPRGAWEGAKSSIEGVRRCIDHDELIDSTPEKLSANPAVGDAFQIEGYHRNTRGIVELVRGNIVVARNENGSLNIFIDGHDANYFGGQNMTAADFLDQAIAREQMFARCNETAVRDAEISGETPLIL